MMILTWVFSARHTSMNAKQKFLKEMRNVTPVNAGIKRKRHKLVIGMQNVLVAWIEQMSHNFPLRPKPNPEQGSNLL